MTARTFLDHNAGSPLRPEAEAALLAAARAGGNASSLHAEGRAARARADRARDAVAALVGGRGDDVVFTSGGTEANATALRPGALLTPAGRPAERLVTVATEHPSVLRGHGFPVGDVTILPVDGAGRLDPAHLRDALAATDRPALVSVAAVNGETGIVSDLEALAAVAAECRAALHVDAVQAAGRMAFAMGPLGAAAVTVSGHKLGAPAGIGALVVAPGRAGPRIRLLSGGDQESRRRGGTENGAGLAAFGAAAEATAQGAEAEALRLAALRDEAQSAVLGMAPGAVVFGAGALRASGRSASPCRASLPRRPSWRSTLQASRSRPGPPVRPERSAARTSWPPWAWRRRWRAVPYGCRSAGIRRVRTWPASSWPSIRFFVAYMGEGRPVRPDPSLIVRRSYAGHRPGRGET